MKRFNGVNYVHKRPILDIWQSSKYAFDKLFCNFDGTEKYHIRSVLNPLTANPTKWTNTLKQFVGFCRSVVFDHFVELALKGLRPCQTAMTKCRFFSLKSSILDVWEGTKHASKKGTFYYLDLFLETAWQKNWV